MYADIDDIDIKILKAMSREGYSSLTLLSERVDLSRFIVGKRIDKLVSEEIIKGQTVLTNPYTLGYTQNVFFEFKTNPHEPWIMESLEAMEFCETLDGISGEYSIIAKFRLKDDLQFKNLLRDIDGLMSRSIFKKYRSVKAVRFYKEFGMVLKESPKKIRLDTLDFKILEILQNPAKYVKKFQPITTIKISKILTEKGSSISQPAVSRRIRRLEENNVILRRVVLIDYGKVKNNLKFVLRIKVNPRYYKKVALSELVAMSEISDLYRTSENYGLLAIVRVENVEKYNEFLIRLYNSSDVLDTHSTLVLDERKQLSVFA